MINLQKLIKARQGRPKKGENLIEIMSTRTIKLPVVHWDAFDKMCFDKGLSEHEALRIAVLQMTYPEANNPDFYL
jgi:hypothetical protein